MFATQTKAVLQTKSESNKKQLSAKALLPDQKETHYSTLKRLRLKTNTPFTPQFKPSGTTTSIEKTGLLEQNLSIS